MNHESKKLSLEKIKEQLEKIEDIEPTLFKDLPEETLKQALHLLYEISEEMTPEI